MSLEIAAPVLEYPTFVVPGKMPNISIISSQVVNPGEVLNTDFTDIARQDMRRRLIAEGIDFYPKDRKQQIPRIDQTGMAVVINGLGIHDPDDREFVGEAIEEIKVFLSGEMIFDEFSHHTDRRAWRNDHETQPDRQVFLDVYEKGNQLRLNNLTVLLLALDSISSVLDPSSTLAEQITETTKYLKGLVSHKGQDLYDQMSKQGKISVIRTFIDESAAILRSLDGVLPLEEITVS